MTKDAKLYLAYTFEEILRQSDGALMKFEDTYFLFSEHTQAGYLYEALKDIDNATKRAFKVLELLSVAEEGPEK